ncbi:KH domain-containing protein [Patescibacteria group bacterium]|nr:KH domain-containing protein [Patescibacteria group bacterium]
MKEFINYLLNQIVTQSEAVTVEMTDDAGTEVYKIKVAQEDMGKVIGKGGRTIRSIRSLVRAKAIKDGIRVRIDLEDDRPFEHQEAAQSVDEESEQNDNL